jgi:hypothetical protein
VGDANAVLVEEAAEAMCDFENFGCFARGNVDHERVLEARLKAALCMLDGEAGE